MEFLAEPPKLQSYVINFNVYRQDRYSILGFKLVDGRPIGNAPAQTFLQAPPTGKCVKKEKLFESQS